jgi:hypothetical protein
MSINAPPRCDLCAEVIGVYEPLIVLVDGQAIETSRAANRTVTALGEECYHRGCYARRHDGDLA